VVAIADEFLQDACDQGESFGVVEADTSCETALGEGAGLGDEELVDLSWGRISMSVEMVWRAGWEFCYLLRCQLHGFV
jgi:hypothetical protein